VADAPNRDFLIQAGIDIIALDKDLATAKEHILASGLGDFSKLLTGLKQLQQASTAAAKGAGDAIKTIQKQTEADIDSQIAKLKKLDAEVRGVRREMMKAISLDIDADVAPQIKQLQALRTQMQALGHDAKLDTIFAQTINQIDAEINAVGKLRAEIAGIGELDPTLIKEAQETESRHNFLSKQSEDLEKAMEGIEFRKSDMLIDEIPGAYKAIEEVMENAKELVKIDFELKQILNCKGD